MRLSRTWRFEAVSGMALAKLLFGVSKFDVDGVLDNMISKSFSVGIIIFKLS